MKNAFITWDLDLPQKRVKFLLTGTDGVEGGVETSVIHKFIELQTYCKAYITFGLKNKQNKLHGLSPLSNYTDRATAASRRS
jgi:hypothetical protein